MQSKTTAWSRLISRKRRKLNSEELPLRFTASQWVAQISLFNVCDLHRTAHHDWSWSTGRDSRVQEAFSLLLRPIGRAGGSATLLQIQIITPRAFVKC
jgi:hypothetical protein